MSGAEAPGGEAIGDLLALLRAWASGDAPAAPRTPVLGLLALARLHKVEQPVAEALSRQTPAAARALLLDPGLAAAEAEARARLEELRAAAGPLTRAGIEPVALKGMAFAARAGAPQPWRSMVDVDVLIPRPQLRRALETLSGAGWRGPDGKVHPRLWGCYAHPTLFAQGPGAGLEVHQRCSYESGGPLAGMAERSVPSALPGVRVPTPEDRMAHMIHHAQIMGRRWFRRQAELRDALDWRALRAEAEIDLEALEARFARAGRAGAVRDFAALMARIWDETPPAGWARDGAAWAEETLAGLADPTLAQPRVSADYRRAAWEMASRPGMLREYAARLLVGPHRRTTLPRVGKMLRRLAGAGG